LRSVILIFFGKEEPTPRIDGKDGWMDGRRRKT